MIRCVFVATDGSDAALDAIGTAVELTQSLGPAARLHVASVVDYIEIPGILGKRPEGAPDLLTQEAQDALDQAKTVVDRAGAQAEFHLLSGDVVDALLACAESVGADILVAGFHGKNRLARLVMGSVVGRLVRSASLPIAIVRRRKT